MILDHLSASKHQSTAAAPWYPCDRAHAQAHRAESEYKQASSPFWLQAISLEHSAVPPKHGATEYRSRVPQWRDCTRDEAAAHPEASERKCPGGDWIPFKAGACSWPKAGRCAFRTWLLAVAAPVVEAPAPEGEIEIIPAEPTFPRSHWTGECSIEDSAGDVQTIDDDGVLFTENGANPRDALALLDRAGANATAIDVRDRARKEIRALRAAYVMAEARVKELHEIYSKQADALRTELKLARTDRDAWRTAAQENSRTIDHRNATIRELRDERDRARHEVKSLKSKYGVGGAGGYTPGAGTYSAEATINLKPDAWKVLLDLIEARVNAAAPAVSWLDVALMMPHTLRTVSTTVKIAPAKPVPCTRDEADRDRAKSEWCAWANKWQACVHTAGELSPLYTYRTTAPLGEHVEVSHTTAKRIREAGVVLENQWDFGARAWVRSPSWKGGDPGARYRVLRSEVPEGFVLG